MRVVLDTNVIVSAFLSPEGKPSTILQLVLWGDMEVCLNAAILAEYEQALHRPKFAETIHQPATIRFFDLLSEIGSIAVGAPSKNIFPDESDRKFYDVAKTVGAILVTGNKKHYPDEPFILSPAQFLDISHFL